MELLTVFLLLVVVACLVYYYGFKSYDFFDKLGVPTLPPVPFLGNMASIIFCREPMAHLIQRTYNFRPDAKYVGMYDVATPIIVLRDLDLIKAVTVKHFEHFVDHRQFVDEDQDPLFAKNLFSLCGEKWKDVRNLLSPAFTSSKMKGMFVLMSETAAVFTEFLRNLPEEKKVMELKDSFGRYTNDVIATCAFGISVDSMKNPKNDFYLYGKYAANFNLIRSLKLFALRSMPTLTKLIKMRLIGDDAARFFQDIVANTIKVRDEKNIYRPDMIQLMMEARGKSETGKDLTIEEMTSQAFIFFFGGFDTTSILMSFVSYELAVKPDIQKRLQDEIDRVMRKTNGQPGYEDVMSMEYLDAVVNEGLRMYPIGVSLDRICVKEYELPPATPDGKPVALKKGMCISIPVYGLHHDPNYYEEPERFNPDRFVEHGKTIVNTGAYFPFGVGPRICIGNRFALLETKVLLCHLLARCDVIPCKWTRIPLRLKRTGLAMHAEGGFWAKVQPRTNPSIPAPVAANGRS